VVGLKLLDYGCGDGFFLGELARQPSFCGIKAVGYEPYMEPRGDTRAVIYKDWKNVEEELAHSGKLDVVTCFEVFEHLNVEQQKSALARIVSVLKPSGSIIISVPIECGPPVLVKNTIRWLKYGRSQPDIYNIRNIVRSFLKLPIPECRVGPGYLSHMGFYWTDLETLLAEGFVVERRSFSPFSFLGSLLNSQVFFVVKA
jgi:SAM-dependent methyltransferase